VNGGGESRLIDACISVRDRHDYYSLQKKKQVIHPMQINIEKKLIKLVPWGTDGRLPLSDLDLGSGHTANRRASLIDLYLRTKCH